MTPRPVRVSDRERHRFLKALAEGATVVAAAGNELLRTRLYRLRRTDPDFARAWDDAYDQGTDLWEAELQRRAIDGWDEPVFQGGRQVGAIRKYDVAALIFGLKARRPEVYRDNARVELTGHGGGPLEVTVEHDYGRLLDKLAQVGLVQRGPAAALDAPAVPVLPARTD